jgi:hypothetical protein
VNDCSGVLDALGRDPTAMSVAQEKAACLRKPSGVGGLGDTVACEEEQGGRDDESWTHGELQSSSSL